MLQLSRGDGRGGLLMHADVWSVFLSHHYMTATLAEIATLDRRHGASAFMAEIAAFTTRSKPINLATMHARDLHVPAGAKIQDVKDAIAKAAAKAAKEATDKGKSAQEIEVAGKPADIKSFLQGRRDTFLGKIRAQNASHSGGDDKISDANLRFINAIMRYFYTAYCTITLEDGGSPVTILLFYRGRSAEFIDDVTDMRNFTPVPLDCLEFFHSGIRYGDHIGDTSEIPLHRETIAMEGTTLEIAFPQYDPRFIVNKWRVTSNGKAFIRSVKALNEAAAVRAATVASPVREPGEETTNENKIKTAPINPTSRVLVSVDSGHADDNHDNVRSDHHNIIRGNSEDASRSAEELVVAASEPLASQLEHKPKKARRDDEKKEKSEKKTNQKEYKNGKKEKDVETLPPSANPPVLGNALAPPQASVLTLSPDEQKKEKRRLADRARRERKRLEKAGETMVTTTSAVANTNEAQEPGATSVSSVVHEFGVPREIAERLLGVPPLKSEDTTTNCIWTDLVDKTGHVPLPSVRDTHLLLLSANKAAGVALPANDKDVAQNTPWTSSAYARLMLTAHAATNPYMNMQPWIDQAGRGATDAPALGSLDLDRLPLALGRDIFERMMHHTFRTANALAITKILLEKQSKAGVTEC